MGLRERLKVNKITQAEFAKHIGVSTRCVEYWVQANKYPLYAHKLLNELSMKPGLNNVDKEK